jgi:hypothetical protein
MKLMGVDVGFSKTRRTTGIACLDGDDLCLCCAGTSWEDRKTRVPVGFRPTVVALDGPLIPKNTEPLVRRSCEFSFVHAPFSKRCKPGLSHFGTGLELRVATSTACTQFGRFLDCGGQVVEAFPNAFLAVLLPESRFPAPKLKRGKRFNWLYDRALELGGLQSAVLNAGLPDEIWRRLEKESDRELRAALICLLTAAFASKGTAAVIGEPTGGWFWLPPFSLWEPWAKRGLTIVAETIAKKGHARLDAFHKT